MRSPSCLPANCSIRRPARWVRVSGREDRHALMGRYRLEALMFGGADGESSAAPAIFRQCFTVSCDYSVAFARGCFDLANPTLAKAIGCAVAAPRPRSVVF